MVRRPTRSKRVKTMPLINLKASPGICRGARKKISTIRRIRNADRLRSSDQNFVTCLWMDFIGRFPPSSGIL